MIALLLASLVATTPPAPPAKLKWHPAIDLPVTGVLGLGWLVSEFAVKKQLAPATCAWCDPNPIDASFRTLFAPRVGPSGSSTSDLVSNITWVSGFLLTLGLDAVLAHRAGALKEFPVDALIICEAVFAAMAVNQTTKFIAARQRPFVAALPAAERAALADPADGNLSFFSGHATFTMSVAVAAGTVALLRGYEGAPLVWLVGVPVSIATGVLRLSADKHNFTDVAVGWLVGAGIGAALPRLFHAAELPVSVGAGPGGIAVAGRF